MNIFDVGSDFNLVDALEWIIDKYYLHSHIILSHISVVFLIAIVIGVSFIKENKKYIMNKLMHNIFYIIIIVSIGELICFLNLMPEIEYPYFNIMVFIILMCLVMGYGVYQMLMFKKVIIPISQVSENIKYIVFFELFLLTVTKHLELVEWVTGTLAVVCIKIISELLERIEDIDDEIVKESDYPNPDLYYTRKKQVKRFSSVLNQQKTEPYAIMVSSEWGMGKSSFMMALEELASEDTFIWIKAGSEKSVSEIMSEISEQIVEVLKKNNILVEKEGMIEKYFFAFSGLLDETKLGFFNKITNVFTSNKSVNAKEYLNNRLKELKNLNKTIYLIIDDLDRCDKDYQLKMFKVIRESTQLVCCKTIFLVDKKEFLGGEYKANHMEKYVNYTLDLCKVEYKEIVGYLIDDLFDREFIQCMNPVLLKDRSDKEFKQMIYQFPNELVQKFESEISKIIFADKMKSEEDIQREEGKFTDIQETVVAIRKNITNSRKVKNFLKGVKRDIENLNIGVDGCSQEYQKEDWLKAIIEVQFLKNILPDIYTSIKLEENLLDAGKGNKSDSIEIVLGLNYRFGYANEKKITILNKIIYDVDVIDFTQIKLEREKYIDELLSNNVTIKHIKEYVRYAETYDSFSEILELCGSQEFDDIADREEFIEAIFKVLSSQSTALKVENQKFYDLSKQLVECLKRFSLTEQEKNICINEGRLITRRVIVDNTHFLKYILMIIHGVGQVEENWKTLSVTDISEFYRMLKRIDKESVPSGLEMQMDKLRSIRTYYENLFVELKKERYKNVGIDFQEVSKEIAIVFEICGLWLDIESVLNNDDKEEVSLFNQYFMLDAVNSFRDIIFLDVANLKKALIVLEKFYNSKAECYDSDFSLILLRVSYRVVLLYESRPEWFENQEKEVAGLLTKLVNSISKLHKVEDSYTKNIIEEIQVFVYKFNSYVIEAEAPNNANQESDNADEEMDELIEIEDDVIIE